MNDTTEICSNAPKHGGKVPESRIEFPVIPVNALNSQSDFGSVPLNLFLLKVRYWSAELLSSELCLYSSPIVPLILFSCSRAPNRLTGRASEILPLNELPPVCNQLILSDCGSLLRSPRSWLSCSSKIRMLVNLAVLEGNEPDMDWLNRIRVSSLERLPILEGMVPESLVAKWTKNRICCGKSASVPAANQSEK